MVKCRTTDGSASWEKNFACQKFKVNNSHSEVGGGSPNTTVISWVQVVPQDIDRCTIDSAYEFDRIEACRMVGGANEISHRTKRDESWGVALIYHDT